MLDSFRKKPVAVQLHALFDDYGLLHVLFGRSEAVDAGNGGHDDDIAALDAGTPSPQWRMRSISSLMSDSFSMYTSSERDIGFGLVVVVIADEVLTALSGKNSLNSPQSWAASVLLWATMSAGRLHLLDDVGHGERLAAAGHTEQRLVREAVLKPVDQLLDGLPAGRPRADSRPAGGTCVLPWSLT